MLLKDRPELSKMLFANGRHGLRGIQPRQYSLKNPNAYAATLIVRRDSDCANLLLNLIVFADTNCYDFSALHCNHKPSRVFSHSRQYSTTVPFVNSRILG